MADPKTPPSDKPLTEKSLSELTIDDLEEGLRKGQLEFAEGHVPTLEETLTEENIYKFLRGEMTWAQLQGMTVNDAYAIAHFGFQYFQEAKYHEARTIFEGLVVCNPYDAYFHSMLGATYQQLDMLDEAMEEYNNAIELDDESRDAYVNRGELHLRKADFDKAHDDLEKAIKLDPTGQHKATARARALAKATSVALAGIRDFLIAKPAANTEKPAATSPAKKP